MNIKKGKIREDINRDIYRARVYFESDDRKHASTVLACASWEYILDSNRINEVEAKHLNQWLEEVIKKWRSFGDKIFEKERHYDVYANTPEGEVNGLEFLQKEINS